MKKVILLCFVAIGFALNASAQDISPNALGLRLGDSDGFGAEISYQRALGSKNNRLELDLGWRSNNNYDAFKLTGLYQWVWNIDGGFNWYAGVGAGVGSWSYDTPGYDGDGTVISLREMLVLSTISTFLYNYHWISVQSLAQTATMDLTSH